ARLELENRRPKEGSRYYLEDIVWQRLGSGDANAGGTTTLSRDAIAFLEHLRSLKVQLEKPPATAELLNWLTASRKAGAENNRGLAEQKAIARMTLTALLKKKPDQERARGKRAASGGDEGELERWLADRKM